MNESERLKQIQKVLTKAVLKAAIDVKNGKNISEISPVIKKIALALKHKGMLGPKYEPEDQLAGDGVPAEDYGGEEVPVQEPEYGVDYKPDDEGSAIMNSAERMKKLLQYLTKKVTKEIQNNTEEGNEAYSLTGKKRTHYTATQSKPKKEGLEGDTEDEAYNLTGKKKTHYSVKPKKNQKNEIK